MKKILKNLLIFAAVLVCQVSFAQSDFWTLTEKPEITDKSGQKVLDFVEKLPNNLGVQFAKINPIEESKQKDGSIAITLDGVEAALSFKIEQCEYTDAKDYYFFATGENGTLTWFNKEGGIGGELELFSQVYSIYPIGDDNVVIMKRDMNFRHKGTCGNIHSDGESPKERAAPFCGLDCGPATVDVLALITPAAATWLNNNWGVYSGWFIYQETHNMNVALWSSGIGQGKILG
jgi:hypothetical protein